VIRIRYQTLGGHTHFTVRSGPATASGHLALAGQLVLDNEDASPLIAALQAADPAHGIELLEGL